MQRFGPPGWPAYPPGAVYGKIYDRDPQLGMAAAWLGARLMASDLLPMGINTDCIPLADVPVVGVRQVIGGRAYGETPARCGDRSAVAAGVAAGGMIPDPQAHPRPRPRPIPTATRSCRWCECRQSDT